MRGPLALLTTEKSFAHPWIGNPRSNRLGLHVARIVVADAFDRVRWALHAPAPCDRGWIETLRRDGIVAIPEFLPAAQFATVRDEVMSSITDSLERFPPRSNTRPGFGSKEPFELGFDRFDGGTLNRYLSIGASTPATRELIRGERFRRLYTSAQGRGVSPSALSIYYLRHGTTRDDQKDLHRDTFHFTIKCWYFVKAVAFGDGPLMYVKGSNHSDRRRLAWEHEQALAASARRTGGAFRITAAELAALDLPAPTAFTVPANTLVIADTHGFHRRGDASAGAERFSIYGGMRRSPYFL